MSLVCLVDFSALYWTAWHSTGAEEAADAPARATVERIRRLADRYQCLAVCADSPRSWRHEMHATYKANREAKPADAKAQLRRALETLKADGFPVWLAENYEADDVIASATAWARREGHEVVIVTGDKDLLQLVGEGVRVESIRAVESEPGVWSYPLLGPAEVRAKFGVEPAQMSDWLALVGDKSDNVEGVPGIGAVKATKLLAAFGDVLAIVDEARRVLAQDPKTLPKGAPMSNKDAVSIIENQAQLGTSLLLTSLKVDVELPWAEALEPRKTKPLPSTNAMKAEEDGEPMEEPMDAEFDETKPEEPAAAPQQPANEGTEEPRPAAKPAKQETEAIVLAAPGTDAWAMALEPASMKQAVWFARQVVDSRLFGNFPNPQAALMAMVRGRELGIPALSALALTHVIDGKLAMHAQMVIGLVLKSRKCDIFKCIHTDAKRAVWRGHRVDDADPTPLDIEFTWEMAEKAGYTFVREGKRAGNWQKVPHTMLRWRAGVELARVLCPEVVGGLYMPEELGGESDVGEAA